MPINSHVTFVHGDILELSLSEIVHAHSACQTHSSPLSSKYKVVANLPYYITSAFLKHMLESLTPPSLAVLLLQREVAQRLVAQPGAMSILAVSVQFYALPRILNRIPAGAFLPRPKVDSSVVRLDLRPQPAVPDVDPAHFFRIVRAGFAQRRKQLRNSLSAGMSSSKEDAELWLHSASIDPSRRAETLSTAGMGNVDQKSVRHTMKRESQDLFAPWWTTWCRLCKRRKNTKTVATRWSNCLQNLRLADQISRRQDSSFQGSRANGNGKTGPLSALTAV